MKPVLQGQVPHFCPCGPYHVARRPFRKHVAGNLGRVSMVSGKDSKLLTRNTILLLGVQNSFVIHTLSEIILGFLAQFKVLESDLADKFEVFFKLLA